MRNDRSNGLGHYYKFTLIILFALTSSAWSGGKTWKSEGGMPSNIVGTCYTCTANSATTMTYEQQVRRGVREDPKMVLCRRVKRVKTKAGTEACVYKGPNRTWTFAVETYCPAEFLCKYEPNGKEPNIDDVVQSINEGFD